MRPTRASEFDPHPDLDPRLGLAVTLCAAAIIFICFWLIVLFLPHKPTPPPIGSRTGPGPTADTHYPYPVSLPTPATNRT